ncbi:MAG: hypothetical protein Q9192_008356 [Flavoplaca navasiana]
MTTSSETPVQSPGTVSIFSSGTMDEKKELPKHVSIAFQSQIDDLADFACAYTKHFAFEYRATKNPTGDLEWLFPYTRPIWRKPLEALCAHLDGRRLDLMMIPIDSKACVSERRVFDKEIGVIVDKMQCLLQETGKIAEHVFDAVMDDNSKIVGARYTVKCS